MRHSAVAAVALSLMLAACSGKPAGQVVATVNGDEITEAMVSAEAAAAGLDPATATARRRQLIQQVVSRLVLVQQARRQKLDRTPAYLAQSARAQQVLLAQMVLPQLVDQPKAPSEQAVAAFVAKNGGQIGDQTVIAVDQLTFQLAAGKKDARWLDAITDMADVEDTLRGSGLPFQRGAAMLEARQLPPVLAAKLIAGSPADLLYYRQGDRVVVLRPIDKSVVRVPAAVQANIARGVLGRADQERQIAGAIKALRDKATIVYKEGAGPPAKPAAAKP